MQDDTPRHIFPRPGCSCPTCSAPDPAPPSVVAMSDRKHVEALLNDDDAELEPFRWNVVSEYYKEGSSDPWRDIEESGVIQAASQAEAIIKLLTGFGKGAGVSPEIQYDRKVIITVEPYDDPSAR